MDTTEIVNFINSSIESSKYRLDVRKIDCNLVKLIRRSIREIYIKLFESDEENVCAGRLRLELLRLQSSPVMVSSSLLADCKLNDLKLTERVWGSDIANISNILDRALRLLVEAGSPLLQELVEQVSKEIKSHGKEKIKIWCHTKEKEAFISLFNNHDIELNDNNFVCSLAEYRKSEIFYVLVRLGPLRSRGWSRTPKVIFSAPRYEKLLQVIWSDSSDEVEFGNDPIFTDLNYISNFVRSEEKVIKNYELDFILDNDDDEDIDDFIFLSKRPVKFKNKTKCFFIEFPGENGVLLTPGSHQLVFVKDTKDTNEACFIYKKADEIEPGDFLLLHNVEADLGTSSSNSNLKNLVSLWKKSLRDMYDMHYSVLIQRMRDSGIDLLDLDRAAKKWMETDGDLITGPQSREHFKILIKDVLPDLKNKISWIKAWEEIQNSRVQAIQHGRIESAIVNEQLVEELRFSISSIGELCDGDNYFRQEINTNSGLTGSVEFYPVTDISEGFEAPNEKLGHIRPVVELELYRENY